MSRGSNSGPIPRIDLSPVVCHGVDAPEARGVLEQVRRAGGEIGFMTVTGHGVGREKIEAVADCARRFFGLAGEAKSAVAPRRWNAASPNHYRGYFPSSVNGKEGFDIGDPQLDASRDALLARPYYETNRFPSELGSGWVTAVADYFDALSQLGRTVMETMVASLGGKPATVGHAFGRPESLSTLRFNGYPAQHEPVEISKEDGAPLACETHVDSGLVTILFQDETGGLQVRGRDRCWHEVLPDEDAFVVNTGRAMARITNGRFAATPHRVLMTTVERLSIPFFFEPRYDCRLAAQTFGLNGGTRGEALDYETFLRRSLAKFPEYDRTP